jgi:hypothetical protein
VFYLSAEHRVLISNDVFIMAVSSKAKFIFHAEVILFFKLQYIGISGFLDFIHRPVFEGTRRFGNWICFRPQVKGGVGEEDTYSIGPLRKN